MNATQMSNIDLQSADWQKLSDSERWTALREVAVRFAQQFKHVPAVNYIENSTTHICVGTSLPRKELIAELPVEFEGVPVKQEGLREMMDGFITTWRLVLNRVGGWPKEKIDSWITGEINNRQHSILYSSWLLHEPPLYWASYALVPDALRIDLQKAKNCIQAAIRAGFRPNDDQFFLHWNREFDWDAARERVQTAIHELEAEMAKP